MILKIGGFSNQISINGENVIVINIENSKLFRNFLENLNNKINGIDSDEIFLLSDDNEIMNMNKEMYIIFDLFNIDYNSKKILNSLYEIIKNNIYKNQDYEIENMMTKIRNYLINEINELPVEITMKQELDIEELLKVFGVKIDKSSYTNILERIELIIDIISTLKIANILVIPNLKQFLDDEELVELYKYSLYNNINLILIERTFENKLKYEINYNIDKEFDDFII